ncbi:MAG: serine hydrolase domain-containing protein [Planctomycetaceae bacterium]
MKPLIEKKKAVGIVVGIVSPDGKRQFFCYGAMKEGGPEPTPDTLFEIGSVSKPITALLLALMVEDGTARLDDPVQKYLPKEIVVPRRGKQEITLLELVTHTSGLPRNPPNQQRLVNKDEAIRLNPYGKYDSKQLAESLAEINLKEEARPAFAYSNLGMGLLGDALAHKAGTSYPELVRTRIFDPLKMKDTTALPSKAQRQRMATGHTSKGTPLPPWTFETLHGCGAICSTPNNMLTLHEAFCGRTETKLKKAMKLTQEKRFPAFPGNNVSLSWFIKDVGGKQVFWHNGGTTGFKMCNAFCVDPAVAVVVLCNTGSDADDDGRDFYRVGDTLIRKLIEAGK